FFLFNPTTAPGSGSYFLQPFEAAVRSINVQPIATPVEDMAGVEHALASLAAGANGGLVVNADIFATRNREAIIAAAARHRVPAVYPFAFFAVSGGLVAYGCDITDLWRRAASYLDRILRGAKPSDLPVQAPVKFEPCHQSQNRQGARTSSPRQIGRARRRGNRMKRREFITLLGGAAAWPLAAHAQQPERVRRIGVLVPAAAGDPVFLARVGAFLQGLAVLGWSIGRNVRVDTRWAITDAAEIRRHAAELVALAPDVILAHGTTTLGPLRQVSRTVPTV